MLAMFGEQQGDWCGWTGWWEREWWEKVMVGLGEEPSRALVFSLSEAAAIRGS